MSLTSWLESLRAGRLGRTGCAARRGRAERPQCAEELEPRALLTVSALLIGSELNVFTDAADSIAIRANAGGQVEILANGAVLTTAPTPNASTVTAIVVAGSDADNVLDLSGVTSAQFTALTSLSTDGGDGNDSITGSPDFADKLIGGDGRDTLNGQGGNDTLFGGDGADSLVGGLGNDSLSGGNNADTITGDAGNDTLDGGDGADSLNAGDGNDNVLGGNGADNIDGGLGNDTINSDGGNDTVTGNAGDDSILGGANNDSLLGGDGNDTINGQAGNDTVSGDAGDDVLYGGDGNDSVSGSNGKDTVSGDNGNDTITGDEGDDSLLGGGGDDSANGGDGNDSIFGQAGNDTLNGGGDSDLLDGGTGNDVLDSGDNGLSVNSVPSVAEGNSGVTGFAVFTVSIDHASTTTVTVGFATSDSTATAGQDYTAVSGMLTFSPGVTSQTVSVPILSDTTFENDEDFFLNLSSAVNARIVNPRGYARITDDDPPPQGAVIGRNFTGSRFGIDSNVASPDTDAAIGPSHIVELLNGRYSVYDKATGTRIQTSTLDQFWTNAGVSFQGSTFDPRVQYDPLSNRWFASSADNATQANQFLVAVSRTSDPTAGWTGFGIDADSDNVQWLDFPTLGVEADAVVLTGEMYGITNGPFSNNVLVIPKSDLTASTPTVANARLLENVLPTTGPSPQTAVNFGPADGIAWLLTANEFGANRLQLSRVQGIGSGAVTVGNAVNITVPAYQPLDLADVPGAAVLLENTARVVSNTYQSGSNLWVVHSVLGTNGNAVLRWYEIDLTTQSLTQSGTLADPNLDLIYPSIAVNSTGTVVIGCTGTSLTQTPSGYAFVGTTTGNVTSFASAIQTQPGIGNGYQVLLQGRNRWGDYSVTTVDPTNPQVFWTIQEFESATNQWGIKFTELLPRPASPAIPSLPPNAFTPGDDTLLGQDGNDTLIAGGANDVLNGMAGNDSLLGNGGNDTILGGSGNDTLSGGDGNDTLDGQSGNDLVTGGLGDDLLVWTGASDGKDTVAGTSGFDTVSVNGTSAADTLVVGQNTNGQITVTQSGVTLVVSSDIVNVAINGNGGNDSITIGSVNYAAGVVLTVNGGDGNDVISAAGALLGNTRLRINGETGNDTLTGSSNNETLDGGDGNDSLNGGLGNDSLIGGLGNDVLNGNEGDDSLDGGDGDDVLRGYAGNDLITGGDGDDSVLGGDGNDSVTGDAGADTLSGDAGNDSLNGGNGADTLLGGDGADTLDGGTAGDSLSGGAGDDLMHGGDGDDTLDGGDGNDSLIGGDGDDQLLGGNGNDAINGGHGNDTLSGQAGKDLLLGSDGADVLLGGADIDTLLGGDGDDTLNGQGGQDLLAGNEGVDTLNDATAVIDEAFALPASVLAALEAF